MPVPRFITAEDIAHARALLRYEPETGLFFWKVTRGRSAKAGDVAGVVSDTGHLQIKVSQRSFKAHRLAWAFQCGLHPDGEIDHINGDRRDNRLANLRLVDRQGNSNNITIVSKRSTTGLLGVRFDKRRNHFGAAITRDGKWRHLGMFRTAEAAHAAYLAARADEDASAPERILARRRSEAFRKGVKNPDPP